MKKSIVMSLLALAAVFVFVSIAYSQTEKAGERKTLTLPDGEVVYDLSGERDDLIENYGQWASFGSFREVVRTTIIAVEESGPQEEGGMDLVQIAEMKSKIIEELRQIEGLKQSMEHTLAGIIEWEKHLQGSAIDLVITAKRRPVVVQEVQPKPPIPVKPAVASPIDRVNKALTKIRGEFTRSQLLAETESDGKGEISTGAYGSIFSRLLQKRRIECVKGSPREINSLYMRKGEKKPDQAPLI